MILNLDKKEAPKKSKRSKKSAAEKKKEALAAKQQGNIRDYAVEYARSDRSQCYYCLEKIPQVCCIIPILFMNKNVQFMLFSRVISESH